MRVPGGQGTRTPRPEVVAWLRAHGAEPQRIMSVCTGAFFLAEAGLLDDRRATTYWQFCDTLAGRHPRIDVDPDPIFVRRPPCAPATTCSSRRDSCGRPHVLSRNRRVARSFLSQNG